MFDNCDQFPHRTQIKLYGHLNKLLSNVKSLFGFITLREYTLNELGHLRGMDAYYHVKTLHMTTASIKGMLKRRFRYATELIDKSGHLPELTWGKNENIKLTMASYKEFLEKWSRTLLDDATVEWILQLTNRDMRESMRIVKGVLGSSKMNIFRMISNFYKQKDVQERTKGDFWKFNMPPDEFLLKTYSWKEIMLDAGQLFL